MTERNSTSNELIDTQKLQEQLEEYYTQLKELPQYQAAQKAKEQLSHYIERNPIQSAAIALGVGFILGWLLSPRHRE